MFRSDKLRRLVASLPCVECGREQHTQAAHSNLSEHGKGRSVKASDAAIMALCVECHAMLDQGSNLTRDERTQLTYRAIANTYITLIENRKLAVAESA